MCYRDFIVYVTKLWFACRPSFVEAHSPGGTLMRADWSGPEVGTTVGATIWQVRSRPEYWPTWHQNSRFSHIQIITRLCTMYASHELCYASMD